MVAHEYETTEKMRGYGYGVDFITRKLLINQGAYGDATITMSEWEFGKDPLHIGYMTSGYAESLEIATALLKATGKSYQIVEVRDNLVTHEPLNGGREYYCGEGVGRVSVNDRHLTPGDLRERAANLLRIADVMDNEEKAETEVSKRRNEVAAYLGWDDYESLTLAERHIIRSIMLVEDKKKEK